MQHSANKQWGCFASTSNGDNTVLFPVSFQSNIYVVLSTAYGLNNSGEAAYAYVGVKTYSTKQVVIRSGQNANGRMWVAYGVQQWGVQTSINRNTTTPIPLVLTMPNADYCCFHTQNLNGDTYARDYLNGGAIYSRTTTILTIYTYSAEYSYNWIVIGR